MSKIRTVVPQNPLAEQQSPSNAPPEQVRPAVPPQDPSVLGMLVVRHAVSVPSMRENDCWHPPPQYSTVSPLYIPHACQLMSAYHSCVGRNIVYWEGGVYISTYQNPLPEQHAPNAAFVHVNPFVPPQEPSGVSGVSLHVPNVTWHPPPQCASVSPLLVRYVCWLA